MIIRTFSGLVLCILLSTPVLAQHSPVSTSDNPRECIPCERPGEFAHFSDSVMDVRFTDGAVLRGVRSAVRTMIRTLDQRDQAVRLTWKEAGVCYDTVVATTAILGFSHEGIGGTQGPLRYPVYPARQIFRSSGARLHRSFAEIVAIGGYGGGDTTSRAIGFSSVYGGVEALIAPLGATLGDYLSLAVGGGALFEGGRTRFPLYGQLRFSLPDRERIETVSHYVPDSCRFTIPGEPATSSPWSHYSERSFSRADSTVFLTEEKAILVDPIRPFVYLEGGTVFDGSFEGAGTPDNAVNPSDRKPLLLGAGIGAPIGDWLVVALGYRYLQLHLATRCEQCVDRTIINRNRVHSIAIKAGYRLVW